MIGYRELNWLNNECVAFLLPSVGIFFQTTPHGGIFGRSRTCTDARWIPLEKSFKLCSLFTIFLYLSLDFNLIHKSQKTSIPDFDIVSNSQDHFRIWWCLEKFFPVNVSRVVLINSVSSTRVLFNNPFNGHFPIEKIGPNLGQVEKRLWIIGNFVAKLSSNVYWNQRWESLFWYLSAKEQLFVDVLLIPAHMISILSSKLSLESGSWLEILLFNRK